MVFFLHSTVEGLLSKLEKERISEVKYISTDALILTSYLPTYKREEYGGIEKLKQLRMEVNCQPAIVVSFESLESLLAVPDNGILDEAGTYHLRLPFAPAQFENLLGSIKRIPTEHIDEIVHRSCTLHGQLDSYVARLTRSLQKEPENVTLTSLKLQNLQRFCAQNWGSWFDNLIGQMQDCIKNNNYESASEVLRVMKQNLPEVATYRAFEELSHGGILDMVNKGFGPLRFFLKSYSQGLTNQKAVQDYFDSSTSWRIFRERLNSLMKDLNALQRFSLGVPQSLRHRVTECTRSIPSLIEMTDSSFAAEKATMWINEIDAFVGIAQTIMDDGEKLKGQLSKFNSENPTQ